MTAKPELTFDRVEIGKIYAERRYQIEADDIIAYCRLVGAPVRVRPSADGTPGRPIAPPTMLVMWTPPRACVDHWIIPPGSVHVGQQWTVHGEVLAGDVVDLRLTAIEKFERDRRQFVVYEARFSIDGTGLVATGRMTGMRRQ